MRELGDVLSGVDMGLILAKPDNSDSSHISGLTPCPSLTCILFAERDMKLEDGEHIMSMDVALMLPPTPDERWTLAKQIGVTHAVTRFPSPSGEEEPWAYEPLMRLKKRFEDAGFTLSVIEDRPPMDNIKMNTSEREKDIDNVRVLLENMGKLDIPVWCSSWMAKFNWRRTSTDVLDRGNSLVTAYDHELMEKAPKIADLSEETLWNGLEYFLNHVTPIAEESDVKMAMHPDDPPLSPIRGVGRIMKSPDAFERMLEIYPSEYNGITLCQGNFAAMNADISETIRRFKDRINFVHFRDVDGTAKKFRETWHDDGPTDMAKAIETYQDIGFDGPIRPDHVPTMAGDQNENPGYEMKGRLFAVGYMKGLLESSASY